MVISTQKKTKDKTQMATAEIRQFDLASTSILSILSSGAPHLPSLPPQVLDQIDVQTRAAIENACNYSEHNCPTLQRITLGSAQIDSSWNEQNGETELIRFKIPVVIEMRIPVCEDNANELFLQNPLVSLHLLDIDGRAVPGTLQMSNESGKQVTATFHSGVFSTHDIFFLAATAFDDNDVQGMYKSRAAELGLEPAASASRIDSIRVTGVAGGARVAHVQVCTRNEVLIGVWKSDMEYICLASLWMG